MLVSVHLLSRFRLSSFHVLSRAASFSVGSLNECDVQNCVDPLRTFLGWSFPLVAAFSMSHMSLLAPFPLSHQTSVTCLHFTGLSSLVFTRSVICPSLSTGWLLLAASFWHPHSAPTSWIFKQAPLFLPCYWSGLGGTCCKHSQSNFITAVLQISACDANRNLHNG